MDRTPRPSVAAVNWGEEYTAQVLDYPHPRWGVIQHLIIRRHDGAEIAAKWDVLQQIKNDMVGAEAFAVEMYPAESAVVDEVNWRLLWIIPAEAMPFGLRPDQWIRD
jgi:hypothetical protein